MENKGQYKEKWDSLRLILEGRKEELLWGGNKLSIIQLDWILSVMTVIENNQKSGELE